MKKVTYGETKEMQSLHWNDVTESIEDVSAFSFSRASVELIVSLVIKNM